MSYYVVQRTNEIGILLALGAQPSYVRKLVVQQGMVRALIGMAIGLVAAFDPRRREPLVWREPDGSGDVRWGFSHPRFGSVVCLLHSRSSRCRCRSIAGDARRVNYEIRPQITQHTNNPSPPKRGDLKWE